MAGTKTAEFCAANAEDGMVNIKNRRCNQLGCTKLPSDDVARTMMAVFCNGYAKDGMVNIRNKRGHPPWLHEATDLPFGRHGP